jgi:selenium metabolism protein YedF
MEEFAMDTIDARDLACPEPVIRTKKALENSKDGKLTVIVNSTEANENVQRFAKSQGCNVKASEKNGVFTLEINKIGQAAETCQTGAAVMLIASDQLGVGDEALGQLLIAAFINTLPEAKTRPAKMLFINRGVMLATEGSRVLDSLQQLESKGVQIFCCGTCLNHYQLKEKLKVGKVTNMYDTVDSLLNADNVIRI